MKIEQAADVSDIGWAVAAGFDGRENSCSYRGPSRVLTHTFTAALNAVAAPLLAVYSDGRLLFGNLAAHAVLRESRWLEIQEGRVVSAAHSESTPLLATAIALLENGVESTVLLTDRNNGEQAVATVAPIASQGAEDLEGVGLLWVTTSDIEQAAVKRVSRLFNLTRAEEQILAQLVGGAGVREAAARHRISIHTARNQLKSIFHKTGRHSQAQLLTLVVRMGSLQVPPR